MSKWILVFLLGSSVCAEAAQDKLTVYLHWQNNVGIQKQKTLHVESRRILVNSRPIDAALWPRIQSNVQKLGEAQLTTDKNCAAGTFTLSVLRKGKAEKESGCLNSKRFAALLSQFEILEKTAQLN